MVEPTPLQASAGAAAAAAAGSAAGASPDLDRNSFHLISLRYLTLAHNLEIFDTFVP